MSISNLLYQKYFLSLLICIISSLTIFFIFSLIGNLNEKYSFFTIMNTSILNSIQILLYVPGFIYLFSIILFTIFLKSKNEIIIIRSYFNLKRLILFILPIVIIFTFFEVNKSKLGISIENYKLNLINTNVGSNYKINLLQNEKNKNYMVFKNINQKDLSTAEYRSYLISNNKIQRAEFSDSLMSLNNNIFAKKFTRYNFNLIEDINDIKKIDINFLNLIQQNSFIKNISKKEHFLLDLKKLNFIVFFILFFTYIFLYFFNKKFVNSKQSLKNPILFCLIILIYSFFVFNNSLSFYKKEFEILASTIMFLFLIKVYLHE
mgnify:CR=1 FL=1|tara:strand:+ start:1013 stop:1969 length:957 start_codon:yes stop_codon:yes gene_type:complete